MAHIAVQLQRTPHGLHPASAVALCWARDIASARGATVTALCNGDAGPADAAMTLAAARFGADILLYGGPNGLPNLCKRLNPVHVLVPYTAFGVGAAAQLDRGDPVPRWIDRRSPPYATADALTAVVAGVRPWHRFDGELDPEYEGDVDAVELPGFSSGAEPADSDSDGDDAFAVFELGAHPIGYVAPGGLDPVVATALAGLGAEAVGWDDAPHHRGGTTVALLDETNPLPETLATRDDTGRVLALVGADAAITEVPALWQHVDWALPGRWSDVVATLREGPWTKAPA